ncbi:unnamed protein product [Trifolium pratense]|uniref:Uncharacterized protein n=1 Tax=Trifolium pratense TaxID=57577 RepID=A0ACB0K9Y2_TRIPR|nr:unnamed protein product [Trifolium pratense]
MVILRELDEDEGRVPISSPSYLEWAQQVRAHYTRANGVLNSRGFYSELWGFDVGSSSSDSDSSSDSGNDSDCVIISPSSFTGKRKNPCRDLVVADYTPVTMEVPSKYTNVEMVKSFRKAVKLSDSPPREDLIITEPVKEGEFVFFKNDNPPHYFYLYTGVIQPLSIWLPFTPFEAEILKVLNVAPTQLHPNSWAFIKAYEVMCSGFELEPSIGVFFSFYHIKNLKPQTLVSLSSQPNRRLLNLYASNFKNFKNSFFRVRSDEKFSDLMYDEVIIGPNWVNKYCVLSSPLSCLSVIIIAYFACYLVAVLLLHTSSSFIGVILRRIHNNWRPPWGKGSNELSIMGSKWEIEKFTGKNDFGLWKVKVRAILTQQKCVEALLGISNMPNTLSNAEKSEMNDKALSVIILCLADNVLREVAKEKTAAAMWTKLDALYMTKSLAHKQCLKERLFFFRMVENKPVVEQLSEFNKIIDDLANIDVNLEDEDKAFHLLCALPKSLENLKDALLYGKEGTITLDEVQSALRTKELTKLRDLRVDDSAGGLNIKNKLADTVKTRSKSKKEGSTVVVNATPISSIPATSSKKKKSAKSTKKVSESSPSISIKSDTVKSKKKKPQSPVKRGLSMSDLYLNKDPSETANVESHVVASGKNANVESSNKINEESVKSVSEKGNQETPSAKENPSSVETLGKTQNIAENVVVSNNPSIPENMAVPTNVITDVTEKSQEKAIVTDAPTGVEPSSIPTDAEKDVEASKGGSSPHANTATGSFGSGSNTEASTEEEVNKESTPEDVADSEPENEAGEDSEKTTNEEQDIVDVDEVPSEEDLQPPPTQKGIGRRLRSRTTTPAPAVTTTPVVTKKTKDNTLKPVKYGPKKGWSKPIPPPEKKKDYNARFIPKTVRPDLSPIPYLEH